jgi:hypothetical protein
MPFLEIAAPTPRLVVGMDGRYEPCKDGARRMACGNLDDRALIVHLGIGPQSNRSGGTLRPDRTLMLAAPKAVVGADERKLEAVM